MIPRPTRKHKFESDFDDFTITAEFDDISYLPKVMEAVVSLQPEPVNSVQAGPEPVYLDAIGKEFGLDSVLAFKMDSGELHLIYIQSMGWSEDTNRWIMVVKRLDGCGNYVNLSGEGGHPAPQLFKLEAIYQEYKELV